MMPPNGRNRCRSLTPDVLSDLPNNVIDVILMLLPCKEAVRTSILSKRWRYHWCRLTKLTLDWSLWKTENDLLNPTDKFTEIISQIFTVHEGPLSRFTLNIVNLESCPEIGNFIYLVLRNSIQHLVLHLPFRKIYEMPSSLFTCSQLRHLSLRYCSIHGRSVFQGFDKLISLKLCEVTISSELLESLISHCPLLEQLVLDIPKHLNTIEIDAPMLRSFNFTGNISSICLKNVPLLVEVSLAGYQIVTEDLDFAKVFKSCSAIEHLRLNFSCVWKFPGGGYEAPARLPFDLNSVKRFYLPEFMLVDAHELSLSLCLIRSFPFLEYLEIDVFHEDEDSGTEESVELKRLSNVTFNHLREVKLVAFTGRTSEMQLIKPLLANSPVLERLLIDRRLLVDVPLDTRLRIFTEVSNCSRASPKAEVVYMD
ncbi:F-box/FBD/LRR-repeat protein At1g13570-like [Solanum dulcamara]|uniref:F-box/FBD/LRR-repeat protein At1g13570-like n=1 Tax=Solanum dulcamara TaxID=45834 RepID=UPI0024853846|nr:F-box/FBD/LRR-repeat protein At1g13570-like [Solanum dulcamara]